MSNDSDALPTAPTAPTEPRRLATGDETWQGLKRRLGRNDLEPLVERLASLMRHMPTDAALAKFADRSPDKWVSAVSGLARLVGYAERRELDINVNVSVAQMSDSQLEAALAASLKEVSAQLVGATAEHVPSGIMLPLNEAAVSNVVQIARNPPPRDTGQVLDIVPIELPATSASDASKQADDC